LENDVVVQPHDCGGDSYLKIAFIIFAAPVNPLFFTFFQLCRGQGRPGRSGFGQTGSNPLRLSSPANDWIKPTSEAGSAWM